MALSGLSWVFAWAALAPLLDEEPIPPTPFDREIVLELSAEDPHLVEGRGPTQIVEYVAEFEGTLHVWASSDLDLFLRVGDTSTMQVLGEDDDSGGGTTPYLRLDVREGDHLAIFVAATTDLTDGETTGQPLVLHFVAAPETAITREAAASAKQAKSESARLQGEGDLAGSRELLKASILKLQSVAGMEYSQGITDVLEDIGFAAYNLEGRAASLEPWLRTHWHRERTLPEDHPDLVRIRANLANSMAAVGDLAGARALEEAVLANYERTLSEDHPYLLTSRNNLANLMRLMGDSAGARALREELLAGYERVLPEDHPDVLGARHNLAISMHEMGDLAGARTLKETVVAAYERTLPEDHRDLLAARANLANSMSDMGDLAGALALREAVLAGYERTLPGDHRLLLRARANLAASMSARGDIAGARALREAVLAGYERTLPDDHRDLLHARTNLANSMSAMGDIAGARALREAVLVARERTLPADDPEVLGARHNLASSMHEMGDLAGARALREAVLAAYERTLPEDHFALLSARTNLATSMSAMGDLAGSRALREAVLTGYERSYPADYPGLLRARYSLALSMSKMDDLAGARALVPSLCAGMRARALGSLALGPRHARQTVRAEESRLAGVRFFCESAGSELRAALFELTETMRLVACEAQRSLAQFTRDPELAPILSEAASIRSALNDRIASTGRGDHDAESIAADLTRLAFERDRLERDASRRLAERGMVTRPVEVQALAGALGAREAAVGYRRMAYWYQGEAPDGRTDGADHLLAHVLRPDGALSRIDLGPAAELEELATAWRTALGAPLLRGVGTTVDGSDAEADAGLRLQGRILDPVLTAAGDDVERLFVCADDLVFLVPLEALPLDEQGDERVGDRVRLVSEVSFARLLATRSPVEGDPSLLALGGVDHDAEGATPEGLAAASAPIDDRDEDDDASGADATRESRGAMPGRFQNLLQSRYEVEATARLFEEAFQVEPALLTRRSTTKAALFEAAPGKRFVHLATHGWFAPETVKSTEDAQPVAPGRATMSVEERVTGFAPMTLCGLALAGANGGRDSLGRVAGILTAEELCSLDLSACELAVLSACETNVGIRRAGQGIQSLQAALYAAGARTSITSLWKVDDAATRRLMEVFYSNLWLDEMPKAEALWAAKKALRDEGHEPRDWAGWILTGNPD